MRTPPRNTAAFTRLATHPAFDATETEWHLEQQDRRAREDAASWGACGDGAA